MTTAYLEVCIQTRVAVLEFPDPNTYSHAGLIQALQEQFARFQEKTHYFPQGEPGADRGGSPFTEAEYTKSKKVATSSTPLTLPLLS